MAAPARKQTREAAPVSAAPAARALLRAPSLYLADRARAGAANVRPGEISPFLAAYLWAESAPFHEHLRPSYLAPRPRELQRARQRSSSQKNASLAISVAQTGK